jgi:hypothetical protein
MRIFVVRWICAAILCSQAAVVFGIEYVGLQGKQGGDAIRAQTFTRVLKNLVDCARSNVDDLLIGAAEFMLEGASPQAAADLLQEVAQNCIPAGGALKALRSGKYKTPADIKRSHYRRHGVANYGQKGSLSERARQRRLDPKHPVSGDRNVAVAEYTRPGMKEPQYMARTSEGTGLKGHSERVLQRDLPKDATVTRVYSERHPCGEGCFEAINNDSRFANATREYTFDHRNNADVADWKSLAERNFPLPNAGPAPLGLPTTIPGF